MNLVNSETAGRSYLTLDHDAFARRAEDLLALVRQMRGEVGLNETVRVAMEQYVYDESHPELARFTKVLVLARQQAVLQQHLDEDREALHHGHLSHEEKVSRGHHYEMLRHEACTYNHLMRGLIESSGQFFTYDELMDWLAAMSQGRRMWAKAEISGATSEIALHAALQGLPELRNLRYGSVEEDLAGYDFVAEWQGALVTIDAKTGYYHPMTELKHGHKHLEISVPREELKGFRVSRHGLDRLRHEARQALVAEYGVEVHAAHVHYRDHGR